MKAAVLHAFGTTENFSLEEVLAPIPQKNEVKIKIKAVSFNPVDYKTRLGNYKIELPVILGTDCSGVIEDIGEDVVGFEVGDEVYAMVFGQGSNGTYAEYTCVPYWFVSKKPENLSLEEAACIPLAGLTAYRATLHLNGLNKKGSVFMAGASGGVGSFAVQLIRYLYTDSIYTIAGSHNAFEHLISNLNIKKENILFYNNFSNEQLKEKLIKLNHTNLFQATFDFVGQERRALCIELTDYSGHTTSIVQEGYNPGLESHLLFQRNLSVHNIFVGAESYGHDLKKCEIYAEHLSHITHLFNIGEIKPLPYQVMGPFEIETIKKAHALLETGHVTGKLVMVVN